MRVLGSPMRVPNDKRDATVSVPIDGGINSSLGTEIPIPVRSLPWVERIENTGWPNKGNCIIREKLR